MTDQPLPDNPLGLTRDQLLASLISQWADLLNCPAPDPVRPLTWPEVTDLCEFLTHQVTHGRG